MKLAKLGCVVSRLGPKNFMETGRHMDKTHKRLLAGGALGAWALAMGFCSSAVATNITINDGYVDSLALGGPRAKGGEDQEVERGSDTSQNWDFQAFFLDGGKLGVVAGFDMNTGVSSGGTAYTMGDIFVRIGSAVNYEAQTLAQREAGWDYVIHFDSRTWNAAAGTGYKVYQNTATDTLTVTPTQGANALFKTANNNAKKWVVTPGADVPVFTSNANAAYEDDRTSAYVTSTYGADMDFLPATGGAHDVLKGIELSWLPVGLGEAYFYTTMMCGNDLLAGKGVPDGGLTLAMLGMSLAGLGAVARRRR
jgi:hypothetical protein